MPVKCDICGKAYPPIWSDNPTQANRCSAQIFDKDGKMFVLGFYGSYSSDGILYEVLTSGYKPGIICDACIKESLDKGEIMRRSDNHFFGINEEDLKL
jgi:hypothetical protein